MSATNSIALSTWTEKSEALLRTIVDVFNSIDYSVAELPHDVYDSKKPISIVFVGQFSAGKSTIIKALTGIKDIVIGSGIQTQKTHTYDWNDIEIIDTPGIHTTLRPDHDEITYDAIANADMLVYVVTQELFDNNIGHNFRKLLLEKDKADEMILVVNKMEDVGNTVANREIKRNDLLKVTDPYSPEQLRTVFIDAQTYLDSLEEPDQELAEEFRQRSNFDELVNTLNSFVLEKGIPARLTTALYKIFEILQKAISNYQPSTGDEDVDMVEEHLLRERHIISDAAWRVESSVKSIYEEAASEIREKGYEVANTIYDCKDEEEANDKIEDAYKAVDQITERCVGDVTKKITDLTEDCKAQLDDFYNSDFSSNLQFRLEEKKHSGNPIINQVLKTDFLSKGSSTILAKTAGSNATANGLKAFSGSQAHEWVLNIGHYFGHSFKPWEAVKWVKKLNIAGKALGVFGVVFSLGMQAKEDIDNEKRREEMRENRDKLRAGFNDAANELRKHFNVALNSFLNENYRKRIEEIDLNISEIRQLRQGKSQACNLLEKAQNDCRLLISDIHKEYGETEIIEQDNE